MGQVSTFTISGNTYSVYALTADPLADANQYFAAHIDAAEWTASTDDNKKKALVTAFRAIERERWSGTKLVEAQTTQWPRTGATKDGVVVPDGVPDDIALGEFELALYTLKDTSTLTNTSTASNVQSVGAGSARVSFFYPLPGSATRWPLPVNDLLAGYLAGAGASLGTILGPYVGGGDANETSITSTDADRSEGFA